MGKIVASKEASVALTLASIKSKHSPKPVLRHVETALTLVKLKAEADKSVGYGDKVLFVYGEEGSDVYKITL